MPAEQTVVGQTTVGHAVSPRPVTPVGIAAELLDDLVRRADGGDLAGDLRRVRDLIGGLDPYLTACATPQSPALAELARRTDDEDWSARSGGVFLEREMLSGHVEGQLLKFLVHATGARRVLEIGMFTGYSALAMAEALPDDGEVVACELDEAVAAFARGCFDASPDGRKITVRVGPAGDTLAELARAGETFDLVFVDADKAGYSGYLEQLLTSGFLGPRAVIAVDNTLLQGEPYAVGDRSANGAAVAEFNRRVAEDLRVEQVLVPLRDGITLIRQVTT